MRRLEINAINVSMPFHVLNIARTYCPGIESGSSLPSKRLPRGVSLPKLLDSLWLPPAAERSEKLNRDQKRYQEIVGALKYPENVDPGLGLMLGFVLVFVFVFAGSGSVHRARGHRARGLQGAAWSTGCAVHRARGRGGWSTGRAVDRAWSGRVADRAWSAWVMAWGCSHSLPTL